MIKNSPAVYFLFGITHFILSCTSNTVKSETESEKYKPVSQELFDTIMQMDSILFDAFNTKDIEKLKVTFSDSLEFYHDKDGLQGYTKTMENFKSLSENKNLADLKRELVPGTVEVYPIQNFGAVQTGSHTFCHTENGKMDCGTFKFVHVWQNKDGKWKLARVISYGH